MDVLNNVATVLEVLGKRTRDLEAQQRQILRNWNGRVKPASNEDWKKKDLTALAFDKEMCWVNTECPVIE